MNLVGSSPADRTVFGRQLKAAVGATIAKAHFVPLPGHCRGENAALCSNGRNAKATLQRRSTR
jgi:hypothetical protein